MAICDPAENALVLRGGTKNDQIDAQKLARLLRLNEYKPIWWQPMEDWHGFKSRMKIYLRQRRVKSAGIQHLIGCDIWEWLFLRESRHHLISVILFSPK